MKFENRIAWGARFSLKSNLRAHLQDCVSIFGYIQGTKNSLGEFSYSTQNTVNSILNTVPNSDRIQTEFRQNSDRILDTVIFEFAMIFK